MRVVVNALFRLIELIDRDPTRVADEQLANGAIDRRDDGSAERRENIESLMSAPAAARLMRWTETTRSCRDRTETWEPPLSGE